MKSIGIILTDQESNSEKLIIKTFKQLLKCKIKKIFFIGSSKYFPELYKKILKIEKFSFININYNKNLHFKYLNDVTNISIKLLQENKINFLINTPLNKKKFFQNKYPGFTEFFASKLQSKGKESMLLYNSKFSVCPITTHEKIKNVSKKISKKKIIKNVLNIYYFYKKVLKKKTHFKVLGLNPHASKDLKNKNEDNFIIKPAIKKLRQKKIDIVGPLSADTAFNSIKKNSVYIGMYHDQVLIPFKLINKFNGINITLGLNFLRISMDHGVGNPRDNLKLINNESFVKAIEFCEKYKNV